MYLKVSEIHTLYVEEIGNPNGIPILFIHPWPWAGFSNKDKDFFDLNKFRVILFDQRWAWKSLPFWELKENNTLELIKDIEKIREYFNIDKWVLFWWSWWSTLSLLYAIEFPNRVLSMILRGIFLWTKQELDWFVSDNWASNFFPESFDILKDFFKDKKWREIVNDYFSKLNSIEAEKYAKIWNKYESSLMKLEWYNNLEKNNEINLALAKLEIYYFVNNFFIDENYIIKNIKKIENIKVSIIQGRYDIICPPLYAWKLHKKLKKSNIKFVLGWHSPYEKNIFNELKNEVAQITF